MYDAIVVGAGLYGAIITYRLRKANKKVLVLDRREVVGGNVYTEVVNNIPVHMYGAHIFRTNDEIIWNWLNSRCEMVPFINSPLAEHNGKLYNLPFNMNTFYQLWGVKTSEEAMQKIKSQCIHLDREPENLEEYVLSQVGTDIYESFIKEYTEKQWGKACDQLPVSTMSRIPIRFTFDNNYYANKRYQGIPKFGYTPLIEYLLGDAQVVLNVDGRTINTKSDVPIYYTGCIDEFYDYRLGKLEYRSLYFTHRVVDKKDYQSVAVINHSDKTVPWTRSIEHKHFYTNSPIEDTDTTVVSLEYPCEYCDRREPYYPINNTDNIRLYDEYKQLSSEVNPNIVFCGRLGSYKYTDMEDTIREAISIRI